MEKGYSSVYGIEKASMLKRISAYILDAILTVILASGFVFAISAIINYDSYYDKMNQYYDEFEEENGFSFNMFSKNEDELNDKEKQIKEISSKALEDLTEEEKQIKEEYEKAIDDFVNDKDMLYIYNMLINLTLLMVTISVLLAILIIEFVLPLVFKNGQTIGKKCFGNCNESRYCNYWDTIRFDEQDRLLWIEDKRGDDDNDNGNYSYSHNWNENYSDEGYYYNHYYNEMNGDSVL